MEIKGIIKSKHLDHMRIVTLDKQQQIDVFYTEAKKFDVEELSENQQIHIEVKIQSVDYFSLKLIKPWLSTIISPKINFKYKPKEKGDSGKDWSQNRI